MRQTSILIVTLVALALPGCKKKGGSSEPLAKLQEAADKVCAAKDLPAATKVQEDLAKWSADWTKEHGEAKATEVSEADAKAYADATKKLTDCYTKLTAASASGSAAAPPDQPAGSAATPPTEPAGSGSAAAAPAGSAAAPTDKPADPTAKP